MENIEAKLDLILEKLNLLLLSKQKRRKQDGSTNPEIIELRKRIKEYILLNYFIQESEPNDIEATSDFCKGLTDCLFLKNSRALLVNIGYVMAELGKKSITVRRNGTTVRAYNIKRK